MAINRIIGESAPSVKKIQTAITDVIEHFRSKGYVIPSKLERTPDADCFEVAEKYVKSPTQFNSTRDITVYRAQGSSDASVHELASFRQYDDHPYCVSAADYNEQGQRVRRVFDSGDTGFPNKILEEFEYSGDKVIKETEYMTSFGLTSKTVKTIDPKTGYYTKETTFPGDKSQIREIDHFNDKNQKIMITRMNSSNILVKTKLDPETGNPIAIIVERMLDDGGKMIKECTIDKNTGKISSYKCSLGELSAGFERNPSGQVTYCKDTFGNEFRYDQATQKATMKSRGMEWECSPRNGNDMIAHCGVPFEMERYI